MLTHQNTEADKPISSGQWIQIVSCETSTMKYFLYGVSHFISEVSLHSSDADLVDISLAHIVMGLIYTVVQSNMGFLDSLNQTSQTNHV